MLHRQHNSAHPTPLVNKTSFITGVCVAASLASTASAAPLNAGEVIQALNALGLNSESLACVDVTGNEPTIVLDRLEIEYASYEHYLNLQEAIIANQRIVHISNATLRDHADDTDAQQALDQAETQVILLSNQAHDTKVGLISTILDGLADMSLISTVVHTPGPSQQLPPAYRLAVETADEAKLLVWALKMETMAQSDEEFELSFEATQAISLAHGQYDVQSALIRVTTYEQSNQLTMTEWMLTH